MKSSFHFQITLFSLAVGLVTVLIAWTEYTSWREVRQLRSKLGEVQVESFHLAEHLEARVLALNDTLLRLDLRDLPADRVRFDTESEQLRRWIHTRRNRLHTPEARQVLDQIAHAYEIYLADSLKLIAEMEGDGVEDFIEEHFVRIEDQSRHLLDATAQLTIAQRAALKQFVAEAHRNTVVLQRLLALSLLLLLALAASVAILVYRGMIAPLRGELIESRALIERQEKLASLGTLAAGVAHEIRNPLTAIKVRLFGLQRHLPSNSPEREDTTIISDELNRLERIVKGFLQFARPPDPEFENLNAHDLLNEVLNLLKTQLGQLAINLTMPTNPVISLRADPHQIKQVLINLIQNAAESIGTNGVITLRTSTAVRSLRGRPQPVVLLDVSDTGKGIPRDVQERLFDPFFTTKEQGSGLGLSIAARIVEKHGGSIQYQTHPNFGTTFTIVLPAPPAP